MNKFISIASLFLIYAILIVSSNGETTLLLQENLKKRATSTSEQSTYVQRMISKKLLGPNSDGSKSNIQPQPQPVPRALKPPLCKSEAQLQRTINRLSREVKRLKRQCKPKRIRIPECPESMDRCKPGEKRVKDPNVEWNYGMKNKSQKFKKSRNGKKSFSSRSSSAMLDKCGYIYICKKKRQERPWSRPYYGEWSRPHVNVRPYGGMAKRL